MTTRTRDERGFVLSMVIFAVAALSIAGTALFLVVQSENAMANSGAESSKALHLANAGLSRYMGESFGAPASAVEYQIGGGTVRVTAQPVIVLGDTAQMYLIRSAAEIADRRVPDLVSRRTVQQFALLRTRPFNPVAVISLATASVQTHSQTTIDGSDACAVRPSVGGIATLGPRPHAGTVSSHVLYGSQAEMLEAIDADWGSLTDEAFAVDYQDTWPPMAFVPASPEDSFPTIRFSGDVTISGNAPPSGRGLLVVDGKLTIDARSPWVWDGVIMAGTVDLRNNAYAIINGVLLTGFEGTQSALTQGGFKNLRLRYNSCNVQRAAAGVAILSPVAHTWWEDAP